MNIWLLHGVLACTALSLVFPLGIVRYWTTTKKVHYSTSHWAIQSLGSLMLMTAAAIGLLNSSGISQKHQFLGLLVAGGAMVQQILGFASKAKSSQDGVPGYVCVAHAGLGFSMLFIGWFTMVTGLQLAGVSSTTSGIIASLSAIKIAALVAGSVLVHKRQAQYTRLSAELHTRSHPVDESFALDLYDSEDEHEKDMGSETMRSGRKPMYTDRNVSTG